MLIFQIEQFKKEINDLKGKVTGLINESENSSKIYKVIFLLKFKEVKQQENLSFQTVKSLEKENELLGKSLTKKDETMKKMQEVIEHLNKYIDELKNDISHLKSTIHLKDDEIILNINKLSASENDKQVSFSN